MRVYHEPEFEGGAHKGRFEDSEGAQEALLFESLSELPGFGEEIQMPDGRVLTRILGSRAPQYLCVAPRHFASHSLPYWYEHHKQNGGEFDGKGRCLFSSRNEVDEVVARAKGEGDHLDYDHPR